MGNPRIVPSDQFCRSDLLSGLTGSRGIACEQAGNIFAKIVPDEYIEEHQDIANEDRNY